MSDITWERIIPSGRLHQRYEFPPVYLVPAANVKVHVMKKDIQTLTGLLPHQISEMLPADKARYRGMQIFRWIHQRGAARFDEMTNISKDFRAELAERFSIGALELREVVGSADGTTEKYLWECRDGKRIESVIIRDESRTTACISSQVGCRMGCSFCRTGGMGFIRNLTSGEIVDQFIRMNARLEADGEKITNIVFMGMGEPLDNLESVTAALGIFTMETGPSIAQRKITVSTCGMVPGMRELAAFKKRVGLAISLNATEDRLRDMLMPINRRFPIEDLLAAAREFYDMSGRRVTFEYILMDGINDTDENAKRLLKIVRQVPSKVNLITYNSFDGSPYRRPAEQRVLRFQNILFDGNVTAMLRKSKGDDIMAACGQLASKGPEPA